MAKYINTERLIMSLVDWQFGDAPDERMAAKEHRDAEIQYEVLRKLIEGIEAEIKESAVELIFCKDCAKHNINIGDIKEEPAEPGGMYKFYWKDEACPLVQYRGKAQGHEFDYQFCCCGIRKENP